MDEHIIEKKISNLIADQFPSFYAEEGPVFVQFVKAYYEWMEETDNPLYKARRVLENTDIDDTLEKFLEYFQTKYLYGIPFDVIINKRFLLKHVLDAYRSKGSVQCFKLLFRLIYNQDVEVYLPGIDILRVSDGTWVEPRYIEVTNIDNLQDFVGKTIVGLSSGTIGVVESYIIEPFNENIFATLYLSNVTPKGGDFVVGEKVIDRELRNADNLFEVVSAAPTVLGSLDYVEIINGGTDFRRGDLLKIVHRDINTNQVISFGTEGIVRVSNVGPGFGSIFFNIAAPGSGIMANAETFVFRALSDTTGSGASFEVGSISDTQILEYNTDLIVDYKDKTFDEATWGFPNDPSANADSAMVDFLNFEAGIFGSLSTLASIVTGNNYTAPVDTFVRSTLDSQVLTGTITYNTSSAVITGSGTEFDTIFSSNDVIFLQANNTESDTIEHSVVRTVTNSTSMILYSPPLNESTASAEYRISPSIVPANYASYEPEVFQADETISGLNVIVESNAVTGNSVISNTAVVRSGKGYIDGETVKMYLYGAITDPTVVDGGTGYSNGDQLVFSGSTPSKDASGYVTTHANGTIANSTITYYGAGYEYEPVVLVRTQTGSGAYLTTTIQEFNSTFEVTGRIKKTGIGRGQGYWSTTRGFLNADKYLQDSYFYQDFSYQLRAAEVLNTYKDILYETFHIAGTELFGEFKLTQAESSPIQLISDTNALSGFVYLYWNVDLFYDVDEIVYGGSGTDYGNYIFSWDSEELTYG